MDEATVDRVGRLAFFKQIDASSFRPPITLPELIRNDARLVALSRGDVIVQQGEYGNSVFLVLEGQARVWSRSDLQTSGRASKSRRDRFSLGSMFKELVNPRAYPEVRDPVVYRATTQNVSLTTSSARDRGLKLTDIQAVIDRGQTVPVGAGQLFGEIAALTRSPRAATVFAETDVELLEIRWQGLRDLRERSSQVKAHVDGVYRNNVLRAQLAETPMFKGLNDTVLDEIAARTSFETHGHSEWWHELAKSQIDTESREVVEHEPVIVAEGAVVEDLLLIAAGFGRITQRFGSGHRTLGVFSKNDVIGLPMLLKQRDTGEAQRLPYALRAVGHVDVVRIPREVVVSQILPNLPSTMERREFTKHAPGAENFNGAGTVLGDGIPGPMNRRRGDSAALQTQGIDQSLFDFFFDNRIVNGTATMLINTDRCVGCDECVRACALAHESNPRFVRHGIEHGPLMVANACMHCVDPVCLIGCPTGAIQRDAKDGFIAIDDVLCIGCGTCANSCPYENIRLVEIRSEDGKFIIDESTKAPIVKATKCDLCSGRRGGPACQQACPHDALIRIDMRDREKLHRWINR